MEINIDDRCEYNDDDECCHPDLPPSLKPLSKEDCSKCKKYKMPIKHKSLDLLTQLTMASSTVGWYFQRKIKKDGTNSNELTALINLSEAVKNSELFLISLGLLPPEELDESSDKV